ncbi:PadR family transcriptional regulator [Thermomicrobiaceae bacterium CFH 74404]|uniref:PadR family transcriptional regulator n=1 Tax=Thermalbibacter longus TaxID=2951981 RepID=A0AA42BAS6_9BACT|nr:helix-turn-helix transcriptional regulator [Thermalbibacter longus]MCM8750062.1 PadR family transcriptional regulator [Thermalbibacter longus]
MSGDRNRSLSDNGYALLGLLAVLGERSGYELKKVADQSLRYFYWSPSRSQVYRALRRLEQLGYVTAREVEQESLPDKRLYRITPSGESALRAWLTRRPLPPDDIRSPATLVIFFGDLVPREILLEQLQELRQRAQADLARFDEIEARIGSDPRALFRRLVLRRGIADARETIAWVDEVLATLVRTELETDAGCSVVTADEEL